MREREVLEKYSTAAPVVQYLMQQRSGTRKRSSCGSAALACHCLPARRHTSAARSNLDPIRTTHLLLPPPLSPPPPTYPQTSTHPCRSAWTASPTPSGCGWGVPVRSYVQIYLQIVCGGPERVCASGNCSSLLLPASPLALPSPLCCFLPPFLPLGLANSKVLLVSMASR